MKKISALLILIVLVWGCAHKTAPPTASSKADTDTLTNVSAIDGKDTYVAKCQRCHELKDPANFTVAQWVPLLDKMAGKAHLTDAEKANVMAYVQTNAKQ